MPKKFFISVYDDELDEPFSVYQVDAGTAAETERLVNAQLTPEEKRFPLMEISELRAHAFKKNGGKIKEVKIHDETKI